MRLSSDAGVALISSSVVGVVSVGAVAAAGAAVAEHWCLSGSTCLQQYVFEHVGQVLDAFRLQSWFLRVLPLQVFESILSYMDISLCSIMVVFGL